MYRSTTSFEKRKILTIEELRKELEQYKRILNNTTFDYLNSLLELKNNVLGSGDVDIEFMDLLLRIDIYEKIASYNIYNKSLDILKCEQDKSPFKIEDDSTLNRISAYGIHNVSIQNISLFHYHFDQEGFHIGTFELANNPTIREKEIERLKYICESAHDAGISRSTLQTYEEKLEELLSFTDLSDFEKGQAEIQKNIRNTILEDYGLCSKDFVLQNERTSLGYLNECYVKKFPGIEFVHNVKYY